MESQVTTTIVSGIFSLVATFGTIYLKDYLEKRKINTPAFTPPATDATIPKSTYKPTDDSTVGHAKYPGARPLIILSAGFGIGILNRWLEPLINGGDVHFGNIATLIILLVVSLILLLQRNRHKVEYTELFFQLENIGLWSGYLFGWSLMNGGFWSDIMGVILMSWLACAIIGGIILRILVSSAKK